MSFEVKYNEGITDNLQKRFVLREGTYWTKITAAKSADDDGNPLTTRAGAMKIDLELTALDAEGRDTSHKLRGSVYLPVENPVNGYIAPPDKLNTYISMCYRFARALDTNFPRYARKGDQPGTFVTADGDIVDFAKRTAIKREVDGAVQKAAVSWVNKPEELVGHAFYVPVKHETGTNGKTYANTNMFQVSSEAPDGDIVTDDFTSLT
jgi:hypothetical protein